MEDQFFAFLYGCFAACVVAAMAFAVILNHVNDSWRNDAVERGYAEYYLDENHTAQWRWKDSRP